MRAFARTHSGREVTEEEKDGQSPCRGDSKTPSTTSTMRILRAVGLGIGILVIQWLTPDLFEGLQASLLEFFKMATRLFKAAQSAVVKAGL